MESRLQGARIEAKNQSGVIQATWGDGLTKSGGDGGVWMDRADLISCACKISAG